MGTPVTRRDLVADQRIARAGIGDAQQRFGEAHQRHALLARQRIFPNQTLDAASAGLRPKRLDQVFRPRRGDSPGIGGRFRRRQKGRQAGGLGAAIGGGDRRSQRRLCPNTRRESGKGTGDFGDIHGHPSAKL
jgi:hypothetical protein